uniref:Protein TsetseEP domain-containing protein n=1 Tax=Anopheles atroparvus TaxID=41427 RepID=A0AAG5DAW8_ANOAO
MKAFCFSFVILCVAQIALAIPRPDFGINGDVANSATTASAANVLGTEFAKTGAKDITLTSGYGLLNTLREKLIAIGDAVALKGGELATQLNGLALNDIGPVEDAFGAVNQKITNLKTYIESPIQEITDITNLVSDDIEVQFSDAFDAMKTTITSLNNALTKLKTDVNNAKNAPGNGATVSAANIRKFIPAKSVTDVTVQIRNLRANIPVITYIVNSSLENVELADEFINEIAAEAIVAVADYANAVAEFQANLAAENTALGNVIADNIGDDVTTRLADIQSELDDSTGYSGSGLSDVLATINSGITTDLMAATTAIGGFFTTYSNNVPSLITDLNVELGDALCEPIKAVSEALVANAPYSDFCFSKYSPRVYAFLALTIDAFDTCFEREVIRLTRLDAIVARIVIQISYNVEDLFDNLSVCLGIDDPEQSQCFTDIQPYYQALASKITEHEATLKGLVSKESFASYNRLGSCIATSLFVTVAQGLEVIVDVDTCMEDGPTVTA